MWTSPDVFPALFQNNRNQWTYLDTMNSSTILFDYVRMEWFELDRDFEVSTSSNQVSGGIIKGLGIYERGQNVKITAVASSDYIFKGWNGISKVKVLL